MMQWLRKRSLPARLLVYAGAATLAFALAAGVGAGGALMFRGELKLPGREEPQSLDEQKNDAQPQQKDADAEQEVADSQQDEAGYVSRVGDLQNDSVKTFLESHEKLLL